MNNDNDFYILNEESRFSNNQYLLDSEEFIPMNDSFVFALQNNNKLNVISGKTTSYIENIFNILEENNEKEKFYIKAIQNLRKQKEYINLLYQVSNELITDEEFNYELTENEHRYLINIDNHVSNKNLNLIADIIEKIGEQFTEDDVTEIFSIKTDLIESIIENLKIDNQ